MIAILPSWPSNRSIAPSAPSHAGTRITAENLANLLQIPEVKAGSRQQLCQHLEQLSVPDRCKEDLQQLVQVVAKGVGFYNAPLPKAAKDLIETGMKEGVLPDTWSHLMEQLAAWILGSLLTYYPPFF